jgi:hypothetical protein
MSFRVPINLSFYPGAIEDLMPSGSPHICSAEKNSVMLMKPLLVQGISCR